MCCACFHHSTLDEECAGQSTGVQEKAFLWSREIMDTTWFCVGCNVVMGPLRPSCKPLRAMHAFVIDDGKASASDSVLARGPGKCAASPPPCRSLAGLWLLPVCLQPELHFVFGACGTCILMPILMPGLARPAALASMVWAFAEAHRTFLMVIQQGLMLQTGPVN